MKAPSTANRILIVLAAVLLLMLSATLAWGLVVDYQTRGIVPEGVTLAGQDLGGMTEAEARAAVEQAVSTPVLKPLTVTGNSAAWTIDASQFVKVDVDAMIDEAYAPRREATLVSRLANQVTGESVPTEVEPRISVDATALAQWVAQTAEKIDRKPVNATRKLDGYKFDITPAIDGVKVDRKQAESDIAKALSAEVALSAEGRRSVPLPLKTIKPKITEKKFKQGIIVSLGQKRIWLFEGDQVVRTYRCAPGRPGFSTPTGDFKVIRKLKNAPWINPGSDWAKDMPPSIPPGPYNPMGVRKIGINVPGVFFHGIPPSEFSSIGTLASHGCMRMMPSDVADLYDRVKVGTAVFIRW